MKKIIGMIPARLGSQRVPKKNLRLLDGKPLISYIIQVAKDSGILDDIYINSEAEVFREIADSHGIKFYKRPEIHASNTATNDDFALDFIQNVDCQIMIQLLPTSPFLSPDDIKEFVTRMVREKIETMISVKDVQIECMHDNKPVNFVQIEKTLPSQQLKPVQAYACGIMGWEVSRFKENMKKYNAAYHGGDGSIGFFTLKGYSTVDVDNEEDFMLADAIIGLKKMAAKKAEYYTSEKERNIDVEVDVPTILRKDGVDFMGLFDESNKQLNNIPEIVKTMPGDKSWSQRLINTENNSATLICQLPGEGNRLHYHDNWNEWWYIVDGEWEWEIEGAKIIVKKGDIVFIEKGRIHKITAVGNRPAIRLAVSRQDVAHIYLKN